MNFEGLNKNKEEGESPKLERFDIEDEFAEYIPREFIDDPLGYFEERGANIKSGELKVDEEGRVREDPTATKDLPVWENDEGEEIKTVAKRVNVIKSEVGKSGDPFYEYDVMRRVLEMGLPAARPIARVEQGGTHLIVMERVSGFRWDSESENYLRREGYTDEDIENIKRQVEERMLELKSKFEEAGVERKWKVADMIFDIDIPNKKIIKITPVDWERTKFLQQ